MNATLSMKYMHQRWLAVSNKVDIELKGIDELTKRLEEMGRAGARIENKALKEGGKLLAEEMKKEVPVDTGELQRDIEVSNIRSRKGVKRVDVGPGEKTAWRAKFVELGTSKMTADPFMSRSYEANKNKIQAAIKNEIRKGLGL